MPSFCGPLELSPPDTSHLETEQHHLHTLHPLSPRGSLDFSFWVVTLPCWLWKVRCEGFLSCDCPRDAQIKHILCSCHLMAVFFFDPSPDPSAHHKGVSSTEWNYILAQYKRTSISKTWSNTSTWWVLCPYKYSRFSS